MFIRTYIVILMLNALGGEIMIRYIKLAKQIIINSVWIIGKYGKLKKYLINNYSLERVELFRFKSWHSGYKYLLGFKNNNKYFIKIDSRYKVIENEIIATDRLRRINYENFPKVYYYDQVNSDQFIIMEYIMGESLQTIIDNGDYKNKLYEIIKQLNAILICLQQEGIIHRDIRPENFIINRLEGNTLKVILIDFTFAISFNNDEIREIKNTHKNIKVLSGLGEDYKFNKDKWDDAYSILKILEKFNQEEITYNYDYISIKNMVGKNIYCLGDKWGSNIGGENE